MKKNETEVETTMELTRAIAYLDDIVKSMKAGKVTVHNGDHAITLTPKGAVKAEIKASQKPGKESISVKLAWRTDPVVDEDPSLQIGGDAPKTPATPLA